MSAILPLCAATVATLISSRIFVFCGEAVEMPWLIMKLLFAFSIFVLIISGAEIARNMHKKKTTIYKT
jgi:hypothetical protein